MLPLGYLGLLPLNLFFPSLDFQKDVMQKYYKLEGQISSCEVE